MSIKQKLKFKVDLFDIAFKLKCVPFRIVNDDDNGGRILLKFKLGTQKQVLAWRNYCTIGLIVRISTILVTLTCDILYQDVIGINQRAEIYHAIVMLLVPIMYHSTL